MGGSLAADMDPRAVRVAFCGISHETNTFVTSALGLTPCGPGGFRPVRGEDVLALTGGSYMGGMLAAAGELGYEPVGLLYSNTQPSGTIADEAYESMRDEILTRLKEAMPVDVSATSTPPTTKFPVRDPMSDRAAASGRRDREPRRWRRRKLRRHRGRPRGKHTRDRRPVGTHRRHLVSAKPEIISSFSPLTTAYPDRLYMYTQSGFETFLRTTVCSLIPRDTSDIVCDYSDLHGNISPQMVADCEYLDQLWPNNCNCLHS